LFKGLPFFVQVYFAFGLANASHLNFTGRPSSSSASCGLIVQIGEALIS